MRIALDGQLIYDYAVEALRASDLPLQYPYTNDTMPYREFLHVFENDKDIIRTFHRQLKELCREMVLYSIYEYFLSIPSGVERLYLKMLDDLFIPKRNARGVVTDSTNALGFYVFSDAQAEVAAILEANCPDRWALVDFDFINTTCMLTVGGNLKDHLYALQYGNSRWRGPQYMPNNKTSGILEDNNERPEEVILVTVGKVKHVKPKRTRGSAWQNRPVARRKRRKNTL